MSYFHNFKSNEFSFLKGREKMFLVEKQFKVIIKNYLFTAMFISVTGCCFFKAVAKAFLLFAKH